MKTLITLLLAIVAAAAHPTTIAFKELPELVALADHIVVGKVIKVDAVKANGEVTTDPGTNTGPGRGNTIRYHVAIDKNAILKTSASSIPDLIVIKEWPMWHLGLGTQAQLYDGKTFIFLLKGPEYQWVYPGGFERPLSERPLIEKLIQTPPRAATPR